MNWVFSNAEQIGDLLLAHVALSGPPILAGLVLALALALVARRVPAFTAPLLGLSALLYTIPALPLFIVLPALLGTKILDPMNVVVALTLYAVALLLRSCVEGFQSVPEPVSVSATAIGFSPWQLLLRVELPLAVPVIAAGVRVVSASTVSLVSLGSLIGVNSLGYFFVNGFQRNFPLEIAVGIVGTLLVAAVFDAGIVLCSRLLRPRGLR